PLSVISGTYYVSTPPGSSRIRFEDPRLDKFMGAPPKRTDCRDENKQQMAYDVEAGKVILFESWLRHEVAPQRGPGERVSISFNYDWR
ncbi:MAG TPA: 2OG-Fe(II) oxygenase family protein, partial [Polyangia bacterium]|nr:2OG-Fe(II) oxygenase family protein [Polyangia bacterium]